MGLVLSTSYLFLTLIVQSIVANKFEKQLELNSIAYQEIVVKPSPFNIILWTTNVKTESGYWVGDYSFFDSKPIQFQYIAKQEELINGIETEAVIVQLKKISEGWYCVTKKGNQLLFNDLRFGLMNNNPDDLQFSFCYEITEEKGTFKAVELPNKNQKEAMKLLSKLWVRLKGN